MLEFNGQRWPVARPGTLTLRYHPTFEARPEFQWHFFFSANLPPARPNTVRPLPGPGIDLSLHPVFLPVRHWRELEGYGLRVDSDWQDAHEHFDVDSEVRCAEVEAIVCPDFTLPDIRHEPQFWRADEFRLRFGSREGLLFIFELEAWMEPKEQYERETERRPGEIGTPLGTPPNLVLMTQIEFAWFDVRVPPEAANPADWAFNKVRETFGLRAFAEPQVKPVTRYSFREHRSVEKPGGGWDVSFRPANPD